MYYIQDNKAQLYFENNSNTQHVCSCNVQSLEQVVIKSWNKCHIPMFGNFNPVHGCSIYSAINQALNEQSIAGYSNIVILTSFS